MKPSIVEKVVVLYDNQEFIHSNHEKYCKCFFLISVHAPDSVYSFLVTHNITFCSKDEDFIFCIVHKIKLLFLAKRLCDMTLEIMLFIQF